MKKYIWINLALVVLAGFLGYQLFTVITAEQESLADISGSQKTRKKQNPSRLKNENENPAVGEFYSIIEKNLFDPERSTGEVEEVEEEEVLALDMKYFELSGCISLSNGEKMALILDKKKRNTDRYFVGDTLEDYTIEEIEPLRVYVKKGNATSYLAIFEGSVIDEAKWKPSSKTAAAVSKVNKSKTTQPTTKTSKHTTTKK